MNLYLKRIILLWSAVFFLISGCTLGERQQSADSPPDGWQESSLEVGGSTRWYMIYTPEPLADDLPMVLLLHGGTGSMRSVFHPNAGGTKEWLVLAEQEGFILLVPNGTNPETGDPFGDDQNWNDHRSDSAAGQTTADDVGFILALLEQITAQYPVDQERVYVTGGSNGGLMTYRLLIEAPDRFAAGAAFIANLPEPALNLPVLGKPTPLMISNGTEDPLMPWAGGSVGKDRGIVISAEETAAWWAVANRVNPDQKTSELLPDVDPEDNCRIQKDYFPAGPDGAPLLFYTAQGGGHAMPSGKHPLPDNFLLRWVIGPECRDAEGVTLAWEFFNQTAAAHP